MGSRTMCVGGGRDWQAIFERVGTVRRTSLRPKQRANQTSSQCSNSTAHAHSRCELPDAAIEHSLSERNTGMSSMPTDGRWT